MEIQMAHVDEHNSADLKIRAVFSGGKPLPAEQAAHDIAELFASDIERSLSEYAPDLAFDEPMHRRVLRVFEQRLNAMLTSGSEEPSTLKNYRSLPVANLKPSQILEHGKLQVSLASLYRYVDTNRFYCIVPSGQTNGREFPAWQFEGSAPELLPEVLNALQGALKSEVHAFFVAGQPDLNELAPAEVLAGSAFEVRPSLHESQVRILTLPAIERQRRVLKLLLQQEDAWPPNG
jgi:hypothetical protein